MHGGDGLSPDRPGRRGRSDGEPAGWPNAGARRRALAVLVGALTGCAGASMDFFAAPEPGWEPRPMERIAVVVLGESEEGRERITGSLARAGRARGVRLLSLQELLPRLPEGVVAARLDSARPPDTVEAEAVGREGADTVLVSAGDTAGIPRYGRLASRAFREARIDAVLEISLDAGGRTVDPGIEHSVWDCEQWVESRGRLVCLRPREITFRGDTLYRPWASYDVRLRDPESDRILWRGGAHTAGAGYRRAVEMHRDLVRELVDEMVEDGILPSPGSPDAAGTTRGR